MNTTCNWFRKRCCIKGKMIWNMKYFFFFHSDKFSKSTINIMSKGSECWAIIGFFSSAVIAVTTIFRVICGYTITWFKSCYILTNFINVSCKFMPRNNWIFCQISTFSIVVVMLCPFTDRAGHYFNYNLIISAFRIWNLTHAGIFSSCLVIHQCFHCFCHSTSSLLLLFCHIISNVVLCKKHWIYIVYIINFFTFTHFNSYFYSLLSDCFNVLENSCIKFTSRY